MSSKLQNYASIARRPRNVQHADRDGDRHREAHAHHAVLHARHPQHASDMGRCHRIVPLARRAVRADVRGLLDAQLAAVLSAIRFPRAFGPEKQGVMDCDPAAYPPRATLQPPQRIARAKPHGDRNASRSRDLQANPKTAAMRYAACGNVMLQQSNAT
jgi:hypothetical protein